MSKLKRVWYFIQLGRALRKLHRNPENTPAVFDIADALRKLGSMQEMQRIVRTDPQAVKLIYQKKILGKIELQDLVKLPEGTLGHAYAEHMLRLKLDPDFYRKPAEINDQTYVFLRLRQTHDLWHIATGFDTSVVGEISLQSFMLAQLASPLSIILVGTAILSTAFKQPERLWPGMQGIVDGWQMGRKALPLFPYDWEANWSKPLEEVRHELKIYSQ